MTARSESPRNAPRGPASQRRRGGRTDKDGDLTMGAGAKDRGRIGKSAPPASASGSRGDRASRPARGGRAPRGSLLSGTARSAILRKAASGDVSMKEGRASGPRGGLVELKVTGWDKSKIATTAADSGVSSLIKWMEKKASNRLGSRTREVKIKKVCRRQRSADRRISWLLSTTTSGPPSFAANFRTTTAIRGYGLPYG